MNLGLFVFINIFIYTHTHTLRVEFWNKILIITVKFLLISLINCFAT